MSIHRCSGTLRRLLSSASAPRDPEHGYPPAGSNITSPDDRPLTVIANGPDTLVPTEDKLLIFRTLTGIDTVPVVSHSGYACRPAANIGIYTRVIQYERMGKRMYLVVKSIFLLCLALQIIMGAAVTAMGAAHASYNGITGLGAVATITASIVAYIKGTGQPQKLKDIENRWKGVREHIERRERELCLADCRLDVYREVAIVDKMYQTIKEQFDADKSQRLSQENSSANSSAQATSGGVSTATGTTAGLRRSGEALSNDIREPPHKSTAGLA